MPEVRESLAAFYGLVIPTTAIGTTLGAMVRAPLEYRVKNTRG